MEWNEKYALGVAEIDAQHQELVRRFNRIVDTAANGGHWQDVHLEVTELRRFAEFHFDFEEALMRMYGYADTAVHAVAHRDFFAKLDNIERVAIDNNVKEEVVKFLFDWLMQHILVADQGYVKHLLTNPAIVPTPAAT